MSTSGCILKKKDEYNIENMIKDVRMSITKANLYMNDGFTVSKDDGTIDYFNIGIFDEIGFNLDPDDFGNEEVDQGQSVSFYIESVEEYADDQAFDWVSKGDKLCTVAYIENIRYNEELAFRFIYEYLKLNPQDYFWVEDDWVYTLKDFERLSKLPFDEYWCYKNPNIE